ncbi:hypothetical protein BUALT_Bualt15G0046000 [Buddleja alternifolia]|uniref:TIP41-like protein n=1 Tax=Buddleja alternifolia TaxID=168488 RepID=A0AAV6WCU9_9LAMI|nr:hypothetical protein BUALT_Bualt15G0046000 [Buddleja alternifolia]
MEWESDEKELKAAGAEALGGGRRGLRIGGWEIEWEEKVQTSHFPEMVFGESSLVLKHVNSGIKISFNAFDALCGWKKEALPPVEVPAAAQWKSRSNSDLQEDHPDTRENEGKEKRPFSELVLSCKPTDEVILDYDYTFTTPYCGSASIERSLQSGERAPDEGSCNPHWEDCQEQIDMVALASKESILFYDEVILYEDELGDNGVSLLTVKVRVMPTGWFLLLRFWLRVDGVLMRLRDTRMHCTFRESTEPIILRESCWREATFKALASKGYPTDSAAYSDPGAISERLPIVKRKTQKLVIT